MTETNTELYIISFMVMFGSFEFWSFVLVSDFDIRYSELISSIGYSHR
jgi:hypothetical protein